MRQVPRFRLTRREWLIGAAVTGAGVVLGTPGRAGAATAWKKAICRFCGTGCGVVVGMRGQDVVAVRGDELAHNRGMLCVKGASLIDLPKASGRLLYPKIRKGDRLIRASWDEAMGLVAETLKTTLGRLGPRGVAFYGSGQLTTQESYTANKLWKAGLGSNMIDGNPRLCMASAVAGYVGTFGADEPPGSYEDIEHAHCFFVIGANLAEGHPVLFERVRLRLQAERAARLIVVDPRRTLTAAKAHLYLPVRPGTDLLLLNAMMQVILRSGLVDREFVEAHCQLIGPDGPVTYEDMLRFYDDYAPTKVAPMLGVAASDIETAATWFATSPATMSMWTMGVNQRIEAVYLNSTINNLHLATGHIGRPGATPFSVTGQPNACGGVRDTGALSHVLPLGHVVRKAEDRAWAERAWGVPAGTISPEPGFHALEMFRAMGDGRIGAALVMCTNPGQSLPNLNLFRAAMRRCFLVVADAFDTRTTELASVVLPAALWIEKEGVMGQGERRYQHFPKLLEPPGEARNDLEILVDLAVRLGLGSLITARTPEAVWDEWRAMSKGTKYDFSGMTNERLRRERGLQWPCPSEAHAGTVRRFVPGADPLAKPSRERRLDFYARPGHKAAIHLRAHAPHPETGDRAYPFILTTGRVIDQWHTGTMTMRLPELRKAAKPAYVEIHPLDAARLGIAPRDRVEVRSRRGRLVAEAVVTDVPRTGVVFMSFYDAEVLTNLVVADHVDPISKEPDFKTTAVTVSKV